MPGRTRTNYRCATPSRCGMVYRWRRPRSGVRQWRLQAPPCSNRLPWNGAADPTSSTHVILISIVQSPYLDKRGLVRRMSVVNNPQMWLYEPDEIPKKKHHWKEDRAGFETVGNVFVGKCPRTMSIELAQMLLDSGIA